MKITNPQSDEVIETDCDGCYCHEFPMQFGDLHHGCCSECGCPKNLEGWEHWKAERLLI